jgi:hypothetical protein
MAYELQGNHQRALHVLEESTAIFRGAGDQFRLGWCLVFAGRAAAGLGDLGQAVTYLAQSLNCFRSMSKLREIAVVLAEMSEVAQAQGAHHRAARLAGAVAARSPWYPPGKHAFSLRADCLRVVADAQTRLGDPDFAAAYAEGRAMSLEQAVEYALEGAEADEPPVM